MNIELGILKRYKQHATTEEPNLDLLFDVISDFIKENRWEYEGTERVQDICSLPEKNAITVNCFHLADLFTHMAIKIGMSPEKCHRIELSNFVNKKNSSHIQGSYQSIFSSLLPNEDDLYEFDVHCIAMVDGFCFDLTLQAKYPLLNDGVDIYFCLSIAMNLDDIVEFEHLLPELLNVNEQSLDTGWTLMHLAIFEKKYSFAKLLLESGATDNILDNNNLTALDILNTNIYDPYTPLEDLYQAQEYLVFKMKLVIQNKMKQLDIENRATKVIQSFWKSKRPESSILSIKSNDSICQQANN